MEDFASRTEAQVLRVRGIGQKTLEGELNSSQNIRKYMCIIIQLSKRVSTKFATNKRKHMFLLQLYNLLGVKCV